MRILIAFMYLIYATAASAGGDPARGEKLYNACISCHGETGQGVLSQNSPKIAGLQGCYITDQLRSFKNGTRGGDPADTYGGQMVAISNTLGSDQSIDDVAAYISQLANVPAPVTLAEAGGSGAAIYANCATCHGMEGQGIPALRAPALAGFSDSYLVRQLENFQNGIRGSHLEESTPSQSMATWARTLLSPADIKYVVAYINTLPAR